MNIPRIREVREENYYDGSVRVVFEVDGQFFDYYDEAYIYATEYYPRHRDDGWGAYDSHGEYDDQPYENSYEEKSRFFREEETRGRLVVNSFLTDWARQIRETCNLASHNVTVSAREKGMRVLSHFGPDKGGSFDDFLGSEMEKGFFSIEGEAMSIISEGIKHPADIEDRGIDFVEKAHTFIFRKAKKVGEDAWKAAVRTCLMIQLVGKHERAYETILDLSQKGKPLYGFDAFLEFSTMVYDASLLNEEFHVAFNVFCNGDHAKFLKEVGENTYALLEWMERYRSVNHLHTTDLDLTSRDVSVKLSQDRCNRALDL